MLYLYSGIKDCQIFMKINATFSRKDKGGIGLFPQFLSKKLSELEIVLNIASVLSLYI